MESDTHSVEAEEFLLLLTGSAGAGKAEMRIDTDARNDVRTSPKSRGQIAEVYEKDGRPHPTMMEDKWPP